MTDAAYVSLVPSARAMGAAIAADLALVPDLPDDQAITDTQGGHVVGRSLPSAATSTHPNPMVHASRLAGALLSIHSDSLDELEAVRIATQNRARSIRQVKGGDGTSPEEQRLLALVDALQALEHGVELDLKRSLRGHPLGGWVKRTKGVGEKQGARLIAAIGDPYWNAAADRPRRGPAELWAYCGYHVLHPGQSVGASHTRIAGVDSLGPDHALHEAQNLLVGAEPSDTTDHLPSDSLATGVGGVAPRRSRGVKANWNDTAKMRAFLVAEACMKQRTSPYRTDYDAARVKYADAVHTVPCARCGPKGKPAPTGSPLSLGHQHARALRIVAKNLLRDLFIEAKHLHETGAW